MFEFKYNIMRGEKTVHQKVNILKKGDVYGIAVYEGTAAAPLLVDTLMNSTLEKPVFTSPRGESVIELSGLASDKNTIRSWAIVRFSKAGSSAPHYHAERYEVYFVTSGEARVILGDVVHDSDENPKPVINKQEYILQVGDSIVIPQGKAHQVFSIGEANLELVVPCYPSWHYLDAHEVAEMQVHAEVDAAVEASVQEMHAADVGAATITPLYDRVTERRDLSVSAPDDLASAAGVGSKASI